MLYTLLFSAAILFLLLYRIFSEKSKIGLMKVLVFVVAIFLFYKNSYELLLGICGIILFDILATTYDKKSIGFFAVLSALYLSAMFLSNFVLLGSQAMLFGIISEKSIMKSKNMHLSKSIEVKRDIVQIVMGIASIAILYLFSLSLAIYLLLIFILLGYLFAGTAVSKPGIKTSKFLYSLEREGAKFGEGAIWLSIGVLIAISFLQSKNLIAIVLIAIFFSDSMATIIGVNFGKLKLPYNRRKSIAGTLTYFIILLLPAYFILGAFSIAIALVAALIESATNKIDDNFIVPAVLVIIFLLLLAFL